MNFQEKLVQLRNEKGILQKDLVKDLNLNLHTYQRFEYGQQEPRLSTLIALADFYGLSLDELACRDWPL
ncbi:helix-turn-helix transcriptional regulator [Oscillospiraceae bacterium 38-13]